MCVFTHEVISSTENFRLVLVYFYFVAFEYWFSFFIFVSF